VYRSYGNDFKTETWDKTIYSRFVWKCGVTPVFKKVYFFY
jgi:hypothetical protein